MKQQEKYEVERGIPLPERQYRPRSQSPYPWADMKQGNPGTSFAVVIPTAEQIPKMRQSVHSAVSYRVKQNPHEVYTVRILQEDHAMVARVWRMMDRAKPR